MIKTRLALLTCAALLASSPVAGTDPFRSKSAAPDFLPVDEAFEIQPLEVRDGKLIVGWRIAPEYYLYQHRLKFTLAEPGGATLGQASLPEGEKHMDAHFGETVIYRDRLEVSFALPPGNAPYAVEVGYQGCADKGLCYPPQTRKLDTR